MSPRPSRKKPAPRRSRTAEAQKPRQAPAPTYTLALLRRTRAFLAVWGPRTTTRSLSLLRRLWAHTSPRLARGRSRLAHGMARAFRGLGRRAWSARALLFRGGYRALWWGSLAAFVFSAQASLGGFADFHTVQLANVYNGVGLGLGVLVFLVAFERRVRAAAFGLATAHAALALTLWWS